MKSYILLFLISIISIPTFGQKFHIGVPVHYGRTVQSGGITSTGNGGLQFNKMKEGQHIGAGLLGQVRFFYDREDHFSIALEAGVMQNMQKWRFMDNGFIERHEGNTINKFRFQQFYTTYTLGAQFAYPIMSKSKFLKRIYAQGNVNFNTINGKDIKDVYVTGGTTTTEITYNKESPTVITFSPEIGYQAFLTGKNLISFGLRYDISSISPFALKYTAENKSGTQDFEDQYNPSGSVLSLTVRFDYSLGKD